MKITEKTQQKFIACEVGSPDQILLVSFTTETPTCLIALELINAGFKTRLPCETIWVQQKGQQGVSGAGCSLQQPSPWWELSKWDFSPVEIKGKIAIDLNRSFSPPHTGKGLCVI